VLDEDLHRWVAGQLPAEASRVLEIGAGGGELAAALRADGREVTAIDPAADADGVARVALADLDAAPTRFDAAVAVVSLHHVAPLSESLDVLARALRPGSPLLVDELDSAALDERAAAWVLDRFDDAHGKSPAQFVTEVRAHIHPLDEILVGLTGAGFRVGPVKRGAYLYRWHGTTEYGPAERAAIAAGELPAVGVRFVARRPAQLRAAAEPRSG